MKKLFLTSIAALFLTTGAAHATCAVDADQDPTKFPCNEAELGDEYTCDGSDVDTVYMRHDHLLSDLSSHSITVRTPLMTARKSKRYPVVRYDIQTHKLTLNGKRCRLHCREGQCE